ncbi:hypothetical protein [Streptomyces sp. NPDC048411]|uniref:hypothetical protein n=1 Tax=Streptomyces sp. NPDC048411 TaxID=3157206 RepID=UPI0034533973
MEAEFAGEFETHLTVLLTGTGRGTLTERRTAALLRSAEPRAAGFPVIRVKIEASPWARTYRRRRIRAAAR